MTEITTLIACLECDLVQNLPALRAGQRARCPRCNATLHTERANANTKVLALSLTGLVLFTLANSFTFMRFELNARVQENSLISGAYELYDWGRAPLALLVLVVSILAPLIKLLAQTYVLGALHLGLRARHLMRVFRLVEWLHPWAMMEVYLVGVLVAIVKLSEIAIIVPGLALYSFSALIVIMALSDITLEPRPVWDALGRDL